MTIYFNAFIGSCGPPERVLSAKHQLPQRDHSSRCFSRPGSSAAHHPSHPQKATYSASRKQRPPTALEKRSKKYFFKLLSAARTRDNRLLVSAMKSLGEDKEYLQQMRVADPESGDSVHVQDVLLKAASRCGQPILADRLFMVGNVTVAPGGDAWRGERERSSKLVLSYSSTSY